jgi:DNA-binding NtrC family response regulator
MRPDIPVILMSGFSASQATARFGEHHLSGYLQKPFTLSQLRALAEPVLAKQELTMTY